MAPLMFDLSRRQQQQALVLKAHLRALRDYRPGPSAVPIALFRASAPLLSHLAMDKTLGWNGLAEGEVQVHILPGNHDAIVTEPSVRKLAKALSSALDVQRKKSHVARSELSSDTSTMAGGNAK